MKSLEEIKERIEELKEVKDRDVNYEISYLNLALEKPDESYLTLLLMKYDFEVSEDVQIVRALRWVLGK